MIFNIFRLSADFIHLLSVFLLLWKIYRNRSCSGISLKTQQLYCIVFACRYLDLFWNFSSLYNSVMKILFLLCSFGTLYLIQFVLQTSYRKYAAHDNFRILFLIVPCAILATVVNLEYFSPFEILWTFSIFLESVSILPQLFLLRRSNNIDVITADYVFLMGAYRALYIANWVYRYFTEPDYSNVLVWVAGTVQTVVYLDFFYYYLQSRWYGRELDLPK